MNCNSTAHQTGGSLETTMRNKTNNFFIKIYQNSIQLISLCQEYNFPKISL